MDRFVAMIWDEANPSKQAQVNAWGEALRRTSPRWAKALDAPGLRVYSFTHRGDAPVVTLWGGTDGIIVGPLFERGKERHGRIQFLDRGISERAIATRGDYLIKNYWGNYVAFWRRADDGRKTVLRDPCGAVPCFMMEHSGVELLFAHTEDIASLPGLRFTINWTYLQAFILLNYFITKYTGHAEVVELLAGERLERDIGGKARASWAWHGAEIAANPILHSFEGAKAELRAITDACFTAWGNEYGKIVVSLSGGLDSSILVNLLRRVSDSDIFGLHYVGVGYEHYEVKLARIAAAHAGVELIEALQDPQKDQVRQILNAPRLARPKVQSLAVQLDEISEKVAEQTASPCFMIGQGGDNLFLQRASALQTLTDYVSLHGLRNDVWRAAYDSAILQQESIWKATGDLVAQALFPRKWEPFDFLNRPEWCTHRPLKSETITSIPEIYKNHPWYQSASRLPRGKADHLVSIVALYNYYIHHGRGISRDVVYPYISQPIVEFVLRTPTYLLAHGGRDRALERAAFSDLIPDTILRRTSKGAANHYLLQVMQHNFRFYRELILDGTLIQQGWLDRAKIERMLSPEYIVHGGGANFVYLLVAVECWLRSWRASRVSAAA